MTPRRAGPADREPGGRRVDPRVEPVEHGDRRGRRASCRGSAGRHSSGPRHLRAARARGARARRGRACRTCPSSAPARAAARRRPAARRASRPSTRCAPPAAPRRAPRPARRVPRTGSGAPQVSRSGWPTAASPDAAAEAPSAISTPPLIGVPDQPALPEVAPADPDRAGLRRPGRRPAVPRHRQHLVELAHRGLLLPIGRPSSPRAQPSLW